MSLLNDASLVMIPSGYKDGTLYSAKPTNGDGDFTFSRGSNLAATRINSDGLIEKGRENLLLQSNSFDTTWTTDNTSVTSGQLGYDGSNDAWRLTKTANQYAKLIQTISSSNLQTYSFYVKADTLDYAIIYIDASTDVAIWIDLTDGSITNTLRDDFVVSKKVEDISNGWYRCSITTNQSVTQVRIFPNDTETTYGTTSGSIYIQSAQLEQGLVATDYIETGASTAQAGILEDMPRLDYSGGATCPSLLLEPQRTNLLAQSEYFDTTPYSKVNATVTTNDITSPEGQINATKLISTSGASRVETFPTLSDNTNYTASIFAKRGDVDYIMVNFREKSGNQHQTFFDLANGTKGTTNGSPISSSIEAVGDYYRVTLTINSSSGGSTPRLQYLIANTDNNVVTSSGEYIYVYGAMLEEGSYPTSYIPTYGASVTRGIDTAINYNNANLPTAYPFSLFVELEIISTSGGDGITLSDSTSGSAYFTLQYYNNNYVVMARPNGSISQKISTQTTSVGIHKMVGVFTSTQLELFVDGQSLGTATNSQTFNSNINDLLIGQLRVVSDTGSRNPISKALVFNTELSSDEAIQLTTL